VEEIFPVWLNTSSNGADVAGMEIPYLLKVSSEVNITR